MTLDFGTFHQNGAAGPLGFSLFNPSGDRTGLNLTGVAGAGDTAMLSTDLALFTNLLQGNSTGFSALFNTAQIGTYNAMYTLNLEDYLPGGAASSTRRAYSLQLNLTGTVAAVPVPPSLWLLMSGIAGMAAVGRRRSVLAG